MSFQPVIPATGLVGWRFLQRTYAAQFDAFSSSAPARRDEAYFLDRIGGIRTADDLVADRRLLGVALGAFGLQDDLNNRAFIRKVLGDGTTGADSLANRLADTRYRQLSAAFGFGPGETPATTDPARMRAVLERHRTARFEIAVGEQDETMRLALNARRELSDLAGKPTSDDAKWFTIMGLAPLRTVFETALGLPSSFGKLDIDLQLGVLRDKTRVMTGKAEVSQFSDPAAVDRLITRYLARAQLGTLTAGSSSATVALQVLQSSAG